MKKRIKVIAFIVSIFLLVTVTLSACGSLLDSSAGGIGPTPTKDSIPSLASTIMASSMSTVTPAPEVTLNGNPTPTVVPTATVQVSWNASPATMYATAWVVVRNIPATAGKPLRSQAPAVAISVYGSTNGQNVGNGPTWYRISAKDSDPQYIYGGLLTNKKPVINTNPNIGKVIKINLTQQHLSAYENGKLVFEADVTTGMPELPTPVGTYHVFLKQSPTMFYSPWPKGDPYYYDPLYINYALEFREGGYYMHDATWRSAFGKGTNVPHKTASGGTSTGSHGCVTMALESAAWIYKWAPMGTTVIISN